MGSKVENPWGSDGRGEGEGIRSGSWVNRGDRDGGGVGEGR